MFHEYSERLSLFVLTHVRTENRNGIFSGQCSKKKMKTKEYDAFQVQYNLGRHLNQGIVMNTKGMAGFQ